MEGIVTEAEKDNSQPGAFKLWFGFLGSAAAWAVHAALGYPLVPLVCSTGLVILLYLLSILTAVVAAAAGVVSWRSWKAAGGGSAGNLIGSDTRVGFMAFTGVLASGFFVLAIIMATVPMILIDPCSGI
jgi:hypothetical protein